MNKITHDTTHARQFKESPKLEGYYYSAKRAREARDNGRLLTIRIETSRECNLKCKYCCNRSGQALPGEIPYSKLIDLIDQAKGLKAESVIVIGGGEPTIYPRFKDLIRHIHSVDMIPVIFTNSQTITAGLAKFLYANNVSVLTKLDSLDEALQDDIVGVSGAYKNIMLGLKHLNEAGYSNSKDRQNLKLGASFVVNRQNAYDVTRVWRFCRDNNMFPNLEMMVPNENGNDINHLLLNRQEWEALKLTILDIDRSEYHYDWLPYTPLLACGCFQVMYNLYITVTGAVRPCSSIHAEVANIKDYSLKEIIELPFFKLARNVDKHLKGKCGKCGFHSQCIGCRGLSYAYGKNIGQEPFEALCGEDPSCFKSN